MKALVLRAQAGHVTPPPSVAGRVAPGSGAAVGPLRAARRRRARAARTATGCGCGPAWPASAAPTSPPSTARSSPLLRADRVVPVHARPRGGRRPRRRRRAPSSSRCSSCVDPRHRPAVPSVRRPGASTTASASPSATSSPACRAGSAPTPAAAGPTPMVAHRSQLARRPRRPLRRGGGDGRADRLRRARRPLGRQRRRRVAVIGTGTLGLLDHRRAAAATPPSATLVATAKHPDQRAPGRASSAPTGSSPPASWPRAVRAGTGVVRSIGGQLTGGVDVVVDCVGSRGVDHPGAARRRPRRRRSILVGMPGHTTPRPHRPLAPRDRAAGLLRLHAATTSSRPSASSPRPTSAGWSPPPIPSPATPRPSSTRQRRPARRRQDRLRPPRREAPMRTPSPLLASSPTIGAGHHGRPPDAPSRLRPRRRPLDAADPVPPRRGVPAREAARRPHPRRSTPASRSTPLEDVDAAIRDALLEPARQRARSPRCCARA